MIIFKRLVLVFGGLLLVGCSSTSNVSKADEVELFSGGKAEYYNILTDNETGCQYIEVYDYMPSNGRAVAITPRLNSEGKQICE